MEKKWEFAPRDPVAEARISRDLRISPVTARLLVNRGLKDGAAAQAFLRPALESLPDPMTLDGVAAAVTRIERALRDKEPIAIWGDYDVDGTTATAILQKFFALVGTPVLVRVPHRVTDGYGLSEAVVERFAVDGVKVLITVDCGTSNVREIALAASRGIDVIVLDHHEAPAVLPAAHAFINPKIPGSTYAFKGMSSAGLAFKLAWALSNGMNRSAKRRDDFQAFLLDALGYAALGIVADVSPLLGENRVFVKYGMDALRAASSPGLKALIARARLDEGPIDTEAISFRLAPRLNALGRVGSAMDCLELLTTSDASRIQTLMDLLESSNRARKDIETSIHEEARTRVGSESVIVVSDPRWHVGVVGIVAARLVDEFGRPAFVLAEDNGAAKGSGRSIEGFALHEALNSCRDLLISGGGHARAAGVTLKSEHVAAFRERINAYAQSRLSEESRAPTLRVDDELPLASVTPGLVREIGLLAPHGEANPKPVFVASHLRLSGAPRLMGRGNTHLNFHVSQNNGKAIRAVVFSGGRHFEAVAQATTVSLAFTPQINSWKGREEAELLVEDLKFV